MNENNQVTFIPSNFAIDNKQNSHPIVIFNRNSYWWKRNNKDSIKYVCSNSSCYASLKLKGDEVIKVSGKHYHDELTELEIELAKAKQDLKKAVLSDLSKTVSTHYREMETRLVKSNIPPRIIAAKMPSFPTMSSGLQKRRVKQIPPIPKDFSNLEITGDYSLTSNSEIFLRYDNKSKINRIIMFVDNASLKILSQSEQWFMDGTFKSAPIQLMQLFTIHALVKNRNNSTTFPCVYTLTKRKTKNTYKEVFNVLKNLALRENLILNPKIVMADFEKASTFAVRFHFPNVVVKGCWFHFRQAIFRRAVRIGLKHFYHIDQYREFVNLFGALALLPCEKITEAFELIKQSMPNDNKCEQLVNFFEKQWLIEVSPNIWNHYESDIRTNNNIEGY